MFRFVFKCLFLLIFLSGCDGFYRSFVHTENDVTLKARLQELSAEKKWNLEDSVEIFWTAQAVPYIKAKTDRDLFYATGVVQAHLRGAQLEFLRKLSQGRVSEVLGERALDFDVFLRTIDLGKNHKEVYRNWTEEEKMVAHSFIEGLNDYFKQIKDLPIDLSLVGFEKVEPWSIRDLIYVHKLIGADTNWQLWPQFVSLKNKTTEEKYKDFWKNWVESNFEKSGATPLKPSALNMLNAFSEVGSNAFAVSGKKTRSQKPIVAGDPHLQIMSPSYWLLMGQESPSYKSFGVFMPSFPLQAMGRTRDLAFTGTNMWAVSSFLYELSPENVKAAKKRKETFKIRFSDPKEIEILDSEFGPILSRTKALESKKDFALNWAGHKLSNELGALLKANKAKTVDEFRLAVKDFSVVAINYIVGDSSGNIAKVHAAQIPVLKTKIKNIFQSVKNPVASYHNSMALPYLKNPEKGFVVSANELNDKADYEFCWFCSTKDRYNRISYLLGSKKQIDKDYIQEIQKDVYSDEAMELVGVVSKLQKKYKIEDYGLMVRLNGWNKFYYASLVEPYLYEELLKDIALQVYAYTGLSKEQIEALFSHLSWKKDVLKRLGKFTEPNQKRIFKKAFEKLKSLKVRTWGDVHKIEVAHQLSRLPLLGRSFRFLKVGYPGTSNTIAKAAHSYGGERYDTNFGANLRLIFDMSDPDENHFILLGGQDGFLRSKQSIDQIKPWFEGRYFKAPLTSSEKNNFVEHTLLN